MCVEETRQKKKPPSSPPFVISVPYSGVLMERAFFFWSRSVFLFNNIRNAINHGSRRTGDLAIIRKNARDVRRPGIRTESQNHVSKTRVGAAKRAANPHNASLSRALSDEQHSGTHAWSIFSHIRRHRPTGLIDWRDQRYSTRRPRRRRRRRFHTAHMHTRIFQLGPHFPAGGETKMPAQTHQMM